MKSTQKKDISYGQVRGRWLWIES